MKEFTPSKDMRQGNSLTPFLFLIVAKSLVGLVMQATTKNKLIGVKVGIKNMLVTKNILPFQVVS